MFPTLVLHIADLAHARAQELQSLLHELGQRQDKHRTALQILPRYMRRRAASYNIKRLPRSLRPLADPKTVNRRPRKHAPSVTAHLFSSFRAQQRRSGRLAGTVVDLAIYSRPTPTVNERSNGSKLTSGMPNAFT